MVDDIDSLSRPDTDLVGVEEAVIRGKDSDLAAVTHRGGFREVAEEEHRRSISNGALAGREHLADHDRIAEVAATSRLPRKGADGITPRGGLEPAKHQLGR